MSSREDYKSVSPLDLTTGLVTYKGAEYTYSELMQLFDDEENSYQDEIAELRDMSLDNQVLWGNKKNHFKDDWFYRKRPEKKRRGYPRDLT